MPTNAQKQAAAMAEIDMMARNAGWKTKDTPSLIGASTIYQKLLAVQAELGPIIKDSENPYFKSKYADINSMIKVVKPILQRHGLVLLQPLSSIGSTPAIKTMIIDAKSGDSVSDITPINYTPKNPQEHGSAVTYWRRYALQSMLFLECEDDDGQAASEKVVQLDEPFQTEQKSEQIEVQSPFTEPNPQPSVCPKCKRGQLIERTGKNGKFLGCNSYPQCRYTENIS